VGCRRSQGDNERRDVVKELFQAQPGERREEGGCGKGKGKSGLVKNNIARNEDAMSTEIHVAITLMMRRIIKKNASIRPCCEFVGPSEGGVGVEKQPKNTKI
jgi:hypothetical protein